MRDVVLGIDLGTSGVGVVALEATGGVVARADHPLELVVPRPGWTQQDPDAWRSAAEAALAEVARTVGAERVAAIALAGQMHGMVARDAAGRAVHPAILWNDQRTAAEVDEIHRLVGRDRLVERTGNPAVTGFQLPKVLWLRRHHPAAFARTVRIMLPKDDLGLHLTGEAVAEPCDASGTGAYHLARRAWDHEVLAALDLDPSLWPRLVPPDATVGGLRADVATRTGLRVDTPVIAGAGDNAAAATALGLGVATAGLGSVSLGTSGVVQVPIATPTPDPAGRVHLFAHTDGAFLLLGVTLAAAGSLRWYRDTFAPGRAFDALVAEAATAPVGANGVTFTPYLAGERTPHMRADLRGAFHGLSLATSHADVVRAVLEGVACSLRDALDVVAALARPERLLATGGGAGSDLWLQVLADVLGLPLGRPVDASGASAEVGAAEGAAWLGWRAVGGIAAPPPRVDAWVAPASDRVDATAALLARFRSVAPVRTEPPPRSRA